MVSQSLTQLSVISIVIKVTSLVGHRRIPFNFVVSLPHKHVHCDKALVEPSYSALEKYEEF